MAQALLAIAGVIWLAMGAGHLALTLRDVRKPKAFTPVEPAVLAAMQGAQLRFNPRINLWRSWLGFNLSHSMGVMMFGGGLLFAAQHVATFSASVPLQALALLISLSYLAVALWFWFWGPVLGLSISLLCIIGAVLL